MTKYVFQESIFAADDTVSIAPFAQLTVTESATGDAAELWEDADGLEPISGNVVLADEFGFVRFYVTMGMYDVEILSGGESRTLVDIDIGGSGAAQQSAAAAATSASAAATSASAAAASAAAAAEAGQVSAIAGAVGDVGLSVISDGGVVTTVGSDISINIKAKPRGLLIIAHRGYADLGPQNTMTAFTSALASGATVLELDVQVTSDGQLVCFHDDDMSDLTGGALTGTVASHTWAEMQNIDIGTHYSPIFASSRIPLFSEFLAFAKKAGVQFWAEIKNYRTSADVALIANAVVAAGVEHLCMLSSFVLSDLTAVRAISKVVAINYASGLADYTTGADTLVALGGEIWMTASTARIAANPAHVATLHGMGIKVSAYTPTRSFYVQDMQDYGVDAVFVDRYLPGGV